ncbi:MAG TPA: hypothetical protein DDY04_00075 [Bacteroidales bacterium]|nr:hypothetical protein [Bacteroidales bacterium]
MEGAMFTESGKGSMFFVQLIMMAASKPTPKANLSPLPNLLLMLLIFFGWLCKKRIFIIFMMISLIPKSL